MTLIRSVRGNTPKIGENCFLAENATVVGDVTIGDFCSVWFNTVLRGDVNTITIGDYTNIQDSVVIHCSYQKATTTIGKCVSIAHRAIVHGCTIEDHVLIGMGAIVMDHAVINSGCIIAAGSLVPENMICESGFLYAGAPARKIKKMDESLKEMIKDTTNKYLMYSKWYLKPEDEEL